MGTFQATYQFSLDSGDIPAWAVAQMIESAELAGRDANVFELAGSDITLIEVKEVEKK